MSLRSAAVILLLSVAMAGCRSPVAPDDPNIIRVNGTVRYQTFEGGFWSVRGDDNVTYDPRDGLPAGFQVEGLRVRLEARRLSNIGTIHGAGPVVEILNITRLN
jgi:hypothetical protein